MSTTRYLRYPSYFRKVRNITTDDALRYLGLQTRRSAARAVFTSAGFLATGLLVGATLGMAFAPRRGEQIRREMREKAGSMKARMAQYRERVKSDSERKEEPPPPTA